MTIVNKSTVNDNKDNHFSDTEILYTVSIDTFKNNILLETNEDVYIIRNGITTSTIKNDESWIVFGNRYTENKISLDAVDVNKIELKVNESSHDIKIPKSINKKIWKFDFTKFLFFNANQNT